MPRVVFVPMSMVPALIPVDQAGETLAMATRDNVRAPGIVVAIGPLAGEDYPAAASAAGEIYGQPWARGRVRSNRKHTSRMAVPY